MICHKTEIAFENSKMQVLPNNMLEITLFLVVFLNVTRFLCITLDNGNMISADK